MECVIANDSVLDLKLYPSNIFPEIAIKKVFSNSWKGESEIKRKIILGHLVSDSKLNYVVHFNYGQLSKNIEEEFECMEFEGKQKILLGEIELSGLNIFCQLPLSKKTEIWLEIDFRKHTSDKMDIEQEIILGQPHISDTINIMYIKSSKGQDQSKSSEDISMSFGNLKPNLSEKIDDEEMIDEFEFIPIDDEVL